MNRLEFIGQTHQGKFVSLEDIVRFFDHTMAAYEIVGNIENLQVSGNINTVYPSLQLKIESPNLSKLQESVQFINTNLKNKAYVYGKAFRIEASIDGNFVDLFVCEDN